MKKFKFEPQSLLYLISTYFCSLLLAYFLEEFTRFSALFDLKFFAQRINTDDPLIWDITFEICFLISFIIFHIIFSICILFEVFFMEGGGALCYQRTGELFMAAARPPCP